LSDTTATNFAADKFVCFDLLKSGALPVRFMGSEPGVRMDDLARFKEQILDAWASVRPTKPGRVLGGKHAWRAEVLGV
jgi:hypothetical protein